MKNQNTEQLVSVISSLRSWDLKDKKKKEKSGLKENLLQILPRDEIMTKKYPESIRKKKWPDFQEFLSGMFKGLEGSILYLLQINWLSHF